MIRLLVSFYFTYEELKQDGLDVPFWDCKRFYFTYEELKQEGQNNED